jgi:hypothetical protein
LPVCIEHYLDDQGIVERIAYRAAHGFAKFSHEPLV